MSDRRSRHAPLLAPCTSIEDSSDCRQQNIGPVEMRHGRASTFIEVRQPKQNRRDHQRCPPSHAPLQQVLHPGAKEKFFRCGSKDEYPYPAQERDADSWQVAMRMDEAQRQSQHKNEGREENELPQTSFPVAPFQMEIETGSAQLPDRQKYIQASIHQKQFVQGLQTARPRPFEPAQIHSQPQNQQNQGVSPV